MSQELDDAACRKIDDMVANAQKNSLENIDSIRDEAKRAIGWTPERQREVDKRIDDALRKDTIDFGAPPSFWKCSREEWNECQKISCYKYPTESELFRMTGLRKRCQSRGTYQDLEVCPPTG